VSESRARRRNERAKLDAMVPPVSEVVDHTLMPKYPVTSETGIAHFIHCENPINDRADLSLIRKHSQRKCQKIRFSVHATTILIHIPNFSHMTLVGDIKKILPNKI
jgi:hypothetical protein